jgi:RHS repeat-associated protein
MRNQDKRLAVLLRALTLMLLTCGSAHTFAWTLTATPVSESQINLSWVDVGTGYSVYRWNGSAYVEIASSLGSPWVDTGLASDTRYQYKVRAYMETGGFQESFSSAITFPKAPTNLGVSSVSGVQVNLSWIDNSSSETGFKIERKVGAAGTYSQIATVGANATSYTDTVPSTETTYYYRIRAYNPSDSNYSNEANALALGVPSGLTAAAAAGAQVNLSWADTSGNETGFKIERKTGLGGTYSQIATVGANITSYSEAGLAPGTYYYRVRATNAIGDSSYSNEANASFVLPNAPSGLTATSQPSAQIRLAWTDNSDNETGFKLERKTGAGGTYAQIAAPSANATTYDDSGLSAGTTYYYRIRSTNFAGDSGYSNEVSIVAQMPNVTAGTVTYEYDPFGGPINTNAGGVVATFVNDLRGRKKSMSDPDMGNWTYDYNALSEMIRRTDLKNNVTTMGYDPLGRMKTRSEPDLNSTWTYDSCANGMGKLCQATADNLYVRTHGYDNLGRPISITSTIDTTYNVTTSYDSTGRIDIVTYPTGFQVQYVYKPNGYLQMVRNYTTPTTVYWTATSQSASDKVLGETLDSAINTTRTYDVVDRLKTVATTGPSGTVQNDTYFYDFLGNVRQRTDLQVTENFDYDSLNRLILSSGPNLVTKAYDYDAIGNIVYKTDVGVYTYGTRPHAVASTSGTVNSTYAYDANGNATSWNGRTVVPTSFNMPATITGNGLTYSYTYTAEHERAKLVHSTLGTFIYLHPGGGQLFYEKEIKPGGLVEHKHYINGGSGLVGVYLTRSDSTTEIRYFLKDKLGSIQVVTTNTGAPCQSLAYDAYGKRRLTNGADDPSNTLSGGCTKRGFTSHEHLDEIALIHMNGRIYDPLITRFVTADPFIGNPRDLQSFNRYPYVLNNPLKFVDPSGYECSPGVECVVVTGEREPFFYQSVLDAIRDLSRRREPNWGEPRSPREGDGLNRPPAPDKKPAPLCGGAATLQAIQDFVNQYGVVSVSFNAGAGPGISANVSITREGISGYIGAGLGVGFGIAVTGGLTAGDASDWGVRGAVSGGAGPGANASVLLSQGGTSASAGIGLGIGLGASVTGGYKGTIVPFDQPAGASGGSGNAGSNSGC